MYVMFRLMALVMMMLSMQTVFAAAEADADESVKSTVAEPAILPPAFPGWPERAAFVSAVPAPPLGPYMSTGLQEISRGFACCDKSEDRRAESATLENASWPARRRPPSQWQPEDGEYSFAPVDAVNSMGTVQQDRYENPGMPWGKPMWQPTYQGLPQGRYR